MATAWLFDEWGLWLAGEVGEMAEGSVAIVREKKKGSIYSCQREREGSDTMLSLHGTAYCIAIECYIIYTLQLKR